MFASKFAQPPPPRRSLRKSSKMTTRLLQIRAQPGRLLVVHLPPAGLGHVGQRVLEQVRIVQCEDVRRVRVSVQIGDLVQDLHQIQFRPAAAAKRIGHVAVRPGGELAVIVAAGPGGREFDSREREFAVVRNVGRRRFVAGPVRQESLSERR